MLRKASFVGVAKKCGLIACGFLLATCMFGFTGQIDLAKNAPAWIQAIGSVVAIFAAIGISIFQWYANSKQVEAIEERNRYALYFRAHNVLQRFHGEVSRQMLKARHAPPGSPVALAFTPLPKEVRNLESEFAFLPEVASAGFTAIQQFQSAQSFIINDNVPLSDREAFQLRIEDSNSKCVEALNFLILYLMAQSRRMQ